MSIQTSAQLRALFILLAIAALYGCSFDKKDPAYVSSNESPSLEVPPDLDRPDASANVTIPQSSGRALTEGQPSERPAEVPSGLVSDALEGSESARMVVVQGQPRLRLEDSMDSAFRRSRAALQRLDIELIDSTAEDHSMVIDYKPEVVEKGSFFSRLLRLTPDAENNAGQYRLRLMPGAEESTEIGVYDVSGAPETGNAAREILGLLFSRLG